EFIPTLARSATYSCRSSVQCSRPSRHFLRPFRSAFMFRPMRSKSLLPLAVMLLSGETKTITRAARRRGEECMTQSFLLRAAAPPRENFFKHESSRSPLAVNRQPSTVNPLQPSTPTSPKLRIQLRRHFPQLIAQLLGKPIAQLVQVLENRFD